MCPPQPPATGGICVPRPSVASLGLGTLMSFSIPNLPGIPQRPFKLPERTGGLQSPVRAEPRPGYVSLVTALSTGH